MAADARLHQLPPRRQHGDRRAAVQGAREPARVRRCLHGHRRHRLRRRLRRRDRQRASATPTSSSSSSARAGPSMLQARLRGDDWVRHEVATALELRDAAAARPSAPLRVLPVLIGGAAPPAESALPADLAPLARLGMMTFDERSLKASINTLLEAIQGEDFEGKVRRLQEERRQARGGAAARWSASGSARQARCASRASRRASALVPRRAGRTCSTTSTSTRESPSATMLLARIVAPGAAMERRGRPGRHRRNERARDRPQVRPELARRARGADRPTPRRPRRARWRSTWCSRIRRRAPPTPRCSAALAATREKMPVVFGVQSPARRRRGADARAVRSAGAARDQLRRPGGAARPIAVARSPGYAPPPLQAPPTTARRSRSTRRSAGAPTAVVRARRVQRRRPRRADRRARANVVVRLRRAATKSERSSTTRARRSTTRSRLRTSSRKGDRVVSQLIDPYALPALGTSRRNASPTSGSSPAIRRRWRC